jgi:hypothetical protein
MWPGRRDIEQAGFDEGERAKRDDERHRKGRPDKDVLQLLSMHGLSNAAEPKSSRPL